MATHNKVLPGPKGSDDAINRWMTLLLGIVLIAVTVYLYMAALAHLPGASAHLELIKEKEIMAGAYFYSDVEETRTAQMFLSDTFKYSPDGN
jgi:hypothetical protein